MKQRKRYICVVFFIVPLMGFAQQIGIHFEHGLSWHEVLAKAKRKDKYIFLDCYATWCGPCKLMEREVYTNDTVSAFFNGAFISAKLQVDTSNVDDSDVRKWYPEAQRMIKEYTIGSFPTFLFFSPDGKLVHRGLGYQTPADFVLLGREALDSTQQYYFQLAKYMLRNERDSFSMRLLLRQAILFGDAQAAEKVANVYINKLNAEELFTKDNIELMARYTKKSSERGFDIFRQNAGKIYAADSTMELRYSKGVTETIIYSEEIRPYLRSKSGKPDWRRIRRNLEKYDNLGMETLDAYRPQIIFASEIKPSLTIDPDWKKALRRINEKYPYKKGKEFVISRTVVFYENLLAQTGSSNCKNLVAAAGYYLSAYPRFATPPPLNEFAWTIFQHADAKAELDTALSWAKRAVSLADSSQRGFYSEYIDTYANLLYRLGFRDSAILWEEKATLVNPKESSFAGTLKKMRAGEISW